jgi:hypothetical protein
VGGTGKKLGLARVHLCHRGNSGRSVATATSTAAAGRARTSPEASSRAREGVGLGQTVELLTVNAKKARGSRRELGGVEFGGLLLGGRRWKLGARDVSGGSKLQLRRGFEEDVDAGSIGQDGGASGCRWPRLRTSAGSGALGSSRGARRGEREKGPGEGKVREEEHGASTAPLKGVAAARQLPGSHAGHAGDLAACLSNGGRRPCPFGLGRLCWARWAR